jgi:hypothetical protein
MEQRDDLNFCPAAWKNQNHVQNFWFVVQKLQKLQVYGVNYSLTDLFVWFVCWKYKLKIFMPANTEQWVSAESNRGRLLDSSLSLFQFGRSNMSFVMLQKDKRNLPKLTLINLLTSSTNKTRTSHTTNIYKY